MTVKYPLERADDDGYHGILKLPMLRVGIKECRAVWRDLGDDRRELTYEPLDAADGLTVNAVIDTGCSMTCLSPELIDQLGLRDRPATSAVIRTLTPPGEPYATTQSNGFAVSVMIPGAPASISLLTIETDVRHIGGDMIIGCDILSLCRFTFNGPERWFSLHVMNPA